MTRQHKAKYKVCVNFTTVKGVSMLGREFWVQSQSATHVELRVTETNERVSFARSEVL